MTAFILKLIAVATMLIDHIGAVFPGETPMLFRSVGRIAFPIFVYMIAQGCRYTNNINKYLLRLALFALISEIPFDLAFRLHPIFYENGTVSYGINFLSHTNVFYTLLLGATCIVIFNKAKDWNKPLAVLAALPLMFIAEFIGSDYGAFGVIWIFAVYLANPERKAASAAALSIGILYIYAFNSFANGIALSLGHPWYFFFAMASVALISLYNGKQGPKLKWAFYVFYPLHLTVLAALWFLRA